MSFHSTQEIDIVSYDSDINRVNFQNVEKTNLFINPSNSEQKVLNNPNYSLISQEKTESKLQNTEPPFLPFSESISHNNQHQPEFDDQSIPKFDGHFIPKFDDQSKHENMIAVQLQRKAQEEIQQHLLLLPEKKIGGKKKMRKKKRRISSNGIITEKEEDKEDPSQEENKEEMDMVKLIPPTRFEMEDDTVVKLSAVQKAPEIQLSSDLLTATSTKGFRMVRATRGAVEGTWYFEIKVTHLGHSGHVRLGWSSQRGDIQAPVGFDSHSYAYRDIEGRKVHNAKRMKYGEGYKEGDVIGCYIHLPKTVSKPPNLYNMAMWKEKLYVLKDEDATLTPLQGSMIAFFKNGNFQGVAFENIFCGWYFPSASIYTLPDQEEGASVTFNFGPVFENLPSEWFGLEPALAFSLSPKMPSPTSMVSQLPQTKPNQNGNDMDHENHVIQTENQ